MTTYSAHRRILLKTAASCGPALLLGCGNGGANVEAPTPAPTASGLTQRMPDESAPHNSTWMAYTDSPQIWGTRLLSDVQQALARIANAIVPFEPVNMLVNAGSLATAKIKLDPRVKLLATELDDLWVRDTGPVFVKRSDGVRAAVNFNFNGWGRKQAHGRDKKVAAFIAQQTGVPLLTTHLVLEGGGIEVDGKGTAIITESCVLNNNRNPGLTRTACEQELARLLGITKVIWLPGVAGKDITDGHTDFYARFTAPGVVVAHMDPFTDSYDHAVTTQHLALLRAAKDARGNALRVETLEMPRQTRRPKAADFTAGYVNYYVCNGAVIVPEFGDAGADARARTLISAAYPGRKVVAVNIDPIAEGGGGIHCATQQEIA